MRELLLGVDVGTSSCKAAAVTTDGRELSDARVPTPWRVLPSGAEIEPSALIEIAVTAMRRALDGAGGGTVIGIGVTSMAETGVLLDARGEPVGPAIAWHDLRGADQAEEAARALGRERFEAITGLSLSSVCTLAKYRYLRTAIPAVSGAVRWLNVAEWVVWALGGEQIAELSLASRTGFFDVRDGRWWDEARAWAGMRPGVFPSAMPAGTPAGKLTRLLPEAWGAVLTVAGHDHLVASVGAGAVRSGDLFDSCGSAEALVRAVEPPMDADTVRRAVAHGINVGRHVLPSRLALQGCDQVGLGLRRVMRLLGVPESGLAALDAAALSAGDGVHMHGLTGERAVLSDIGWDPEPGQVWRAALEEAARWECGMVADIADIAGPERRIVAAGGWCRSRTLLAWKRRVVGELTLPVVVEAGCRGAALVAGFAAGLYPSLAGIPAPAV